MAAHQFQLIQMLGQTTIFAIFSLTREMSRHEGTAEQTLEDVQSEIGDRDHDRRGRSPLSPVKRSHVIRFHCPKGHCQRRQRRRDGRVSDLIPMEERTRQRHTTGRQAGAHGGGIVLWFLRMPAAACLAGWRAAVAAF